MFFVSMKGLELSCTLPTWLSVHQTDDKSTSIMWQCTGHKTPMDCCCWLQTCTYPKAEIIFILPVPKVRTKLIFFSLLWWGDGSYNLWGNTYEVFLDYTQQMLYFISDSCVC